MDINLLHVDFFRLLHRMKKLDLGPVFGDLSRGEFFSLETLSRYRLDNPGGEGMRASRLAGRLQMSPPGVSRLLRALEEKGLIERVIDREDRRNTFIRLTEHGTVTQRNARIKARAFMGSVVGEMGERDMRALLTLWSRMIDSMEKVANDIVEGEGECSKSSDT